jgi:S-adenosylmethionine-diacylglycerol 3-amino-3-carboxypropyl transferase
MSADLEVMEDRLSYAQCWEDPALLREALAVGPEDDVLSICSAGDNSFSLLIDGARSVTAIDLSKPQLYLAQLKQVAAQNLPLEGLHCLLGLDAFGRRVFLYHELREHLDEPARTWWDGHEELIRLGLLDQGRFERYLGVFRTRILPLVHRKSTIQSLIKQTGGESQAHFFDQRWDTWRWRGIFKLFFSKTVMARSGRSPEQFRYVEGPVSQEFLRRARHALRELSVRDNPFVEWILTGAYSDLECTHAYLSREGARCLAESEGRIRYVCADLESFLSSCEPGSFSAFNFSNVFEYLSAEQHERILELTVRAARPGARIAYWNLLVPRHRPDSLSDRITRNPERGAALLSQDRSFVYGGFQVEQVR